MASGRNRGRESIRGRPTREPKYSSIPTTYDGVRYPSKLEARVAQELDLLRRAVNPRCRVVDIERQPLVTFASGVKWRVDFLVTLADGRRVWVEAKGKELEPFRIKRALFAHEYPNERLVVVKDGDDVSRLLED